MTLSFGPLKGRIHPAGYPFVLLFAGASFLLFWVSSGLGVFGVFLTLFTVAFFREPTRVPPTDPSLLVSPADGTVVSVGKASPPPEIGHYREGEWTRISIFLSVFDAHVNRMPQKGRVLITSYHKGKFFNAALDKASEKNERNSVVFETGGTNLVITQIAGLIARRILCFVSIGDTVTRGQTFGLIRFGSRVDLYLPSNITPLVRVGQRMVGGETAIAALKLPRTKA